jgi:hypothetical protein
MVDADGHETPMAMADLAISYDAVHASPPPEQGRRD